jgi:hypothetical protein
MAHLRHERAGIGKGRLEAAIEIGAENLK